MRHNEKIKIIFDNDYMFQKFLKHVLHIEIHEHECIYEVRETLPQSHIFCISKNHDLGLTRYTDRRSIFRERGYDARVFVPLKNRGLYTQLLHLFRVFLLFRRE